MSPAKLFGYVFVNLSEFKIRHECGFSKSFLNHYDLGVLLFRYWLRGEKRPFRFRSEMEKWNKMTWCFLLGPLYVHNKHTWFIHKQILSCWRGKAKYSTLSVVVCTLYLILCMIEKLGNYVLLNPTPDVTT